MSYKLRLLCFVLLACLPAFATIERGVMLREGVIYVDPSSDSTKLSNIGRGREVAVMERSKGWANVMGTVDVGYAPEDPETQVERNVTGWIEDKGIILSTTPDGDKILFGEAFDSELEASKRGGRRGAAQDAMRLYAHIPELFPQSPLAAEGLIAPPTFAGRSKRPTPPRVLRPRNAIPGSVCRWTKTSCARS